MPSRFGLAVGGAGVALALATAGCTGISVTSGNSPSSSGGPGSASASAAASGSGGTSSGAAAAIQSSVKTAGDNKSVSVNGTVTSPSGTGKITGQENFAPSFAMAMNFTEGSVDVNEVWNDDTVYIGTPELAGELGGKQWLSLSLDEMGAFGQNFAAEIDVVKNTDPQQLLEPLLASGDLTKVGTETVDGVSTTHYSGSIDPATAFDTAQAKQNLTPAQIQELQRLDSAAGSTKQQIDAWVASNGLPVRIKAVDTDKDGAATTVQLDFTDWGLPVTVTTPPANQVLNVNSLVSGSSSASAGASASAS
ncbi:MAG TPA: hypothetical protein VGM10_06700 [Actinocrinis sp.]|jgi:hypothetical protein